MDFTVCAARFLLQVMIPLRVELTCSPIEETAQAMEDARKAGKTRYILSEVLCWLPAVLTLFVRSARLPPLGRQAKSPRLTSSRSSVSLISCMYTEKPF